MNLPKLFSIVPHCLALRCMGCIEEIINLVTLRQYFKEAIINGYLREILDEIIQQSKVEFNYEEELNE